MNKVKAEKLLTILGVCGVILLVAGMFSSGMVAVWCHSVRTGKLDHVSDDLCVGHCRTGPADEQGLGVITIGNVGGRVPWRLARWPTTTDITSRLCYRSSGIFSWSTTGCRAQTVAGGKGVGAT